MELNLLTSSLFCELQFAKIHLKIFTERSTTHCHTFSNALVTVPNWRHLLHPNAFTVHDPQLLHQCWCKQNVGLSQVANFSDNQLRTSPTCVFVSAFLLIQSTHHWEQMSEQLTWQESCPLMLDPDLEHFESGISQKLTGTSYTN